MHCFSAQSMVTDGNTLDWAPIRREKRTRKERAAVVGFLVVGIVEKRGSGIITVLFRRFVRRFDAKYYFQREDSFVSN